MADYHKHMNNCDTGGCKYNEPDECPVMRAVRLATGQNPVDKTPPITQPSFRQVGGEHYKKMAVQPWDVVDTWPLDQQIGAYRAGALKYVMRMGSKDESVQEIGKGIHYLEKLVEVLKRFQDERS